MSEASGIEMNGGKLQDFTIDQLAGALALSLGAGYAVVSHMAESVSLSNEFMLHIYMRTPSSIGK